VKLHLPGFAIAAKYAGKTFAKWHDGAVENAVGGGNVIVKYDWVAPGTPDHVAVAGRSLFPGDIGQRRADNHLSGR
jgi:hypothetical protein